MQSAGCDRAGWHRRCNPDAAELEASSSRPTDQPARAAAADLPTCATRCWCFSPRGPRSSSCTLPSALLRPGMSSEAFDAGVAAQGTCARVSMQETLVPRACFARLHARHQAALLTSGAGRQDAGRVSCGNHTGAEHLGLTIGRLPPAFSMERAHPYLTTRGPTARPIQAAPSLRSQ